MTTIDLRSIDYRDEPDQEYCSGLDGARLRLELLSHTVMYFPLFPDAHEQALAIADNEDFLQWRAGLAAERKGKFAGEDFMRKFGAILMPANLVRIGMIASQFKVPFGLAFRRMHEIGAFEIEGNRIIWKEKVAS